MRNITLLLSVVISLLLGWSSKAGAEPPEEHGRPHNVPPAFVITPHGYFHPACVFQVEDDEYVDADSRIVRRDGTRVALPLCGYPHYDHRGNPHSPEITPTISWAWVEHLEGVDVEPLGFLSANWTVPPNPTVSGTATVFLFPGLESSSLADDIIQPVLGWNADPNDHTHWSIASWNCCKWGNTIHSTLRDVSAGNNLYGYMIGDNCNVNTGQCSVWQISTSVIGGVSTTLNTSYTEVFDWIFAGALEVYDVSSCREYPGHSGGTTTVSFSSITMRDVASQTFTTTWDGYVTPNLSPSCNYSAPDSSTSGSGSLSWCVPYTQTDACLVAGVCNGETASDGCGGTVTCHCTTSKPYCCPDGACALNAGSCP